jgi:uncharacterized RDD family membrane protein YckC
MKCGTLSSAPEAPALAFTPLSGSFTGVGPGERLWEIALDVVLAVLTAGIGWLIWTIILAKTGQTPAKRLRDKVVVYSRTGTTARPLRFFTRELITTGMFLYLVAGLIWGYGVIIDIGGFWVNTFIIPIVIFLVIVTDIAWLFLPARRRLIDVILRTNVVEGNGISFSSFANQPERGA